jgi:acyl-CoA dehydrogenase
MTAVHTTIDASDLEIVRKATRELSRRFDLEYWRDKDKKGQYPWEFVRAFAEGGWLGTMIPEEYGGIGLGLTASAVMLGEKT